MIGENNEEPMKQGDNNDDYLIKKVSDLSKDLVSYEMFFIDQYGMKYDIHNHC